MLVLRTRTPMSPAKSRSAQRATKPPEPRAGAALTTWSGRRVGRDAGRGAGVDRAVRAVAVDWLIGSPSWRVGSARPREGGPTRIAGCRAVPGRGHLGAAGQQPQVCRVLRERDRQAGRRAVRRAGREDGLGDAVLEGVVGEDDDPAADGERLDRGGQGSLPDRELGVDLDPQGLERPLGRVPSGALGGGGHDVAQQVDEACGRREGCPLPLAHDGRGDLAGEALLAVVAQDPDEVGHGIRVEDVGRRGPAAWSIRMSRGASWA